MAVATLDDLDLDTRDLLAVLASRLDATVGTIKLELIFRDGAFVDGYKSPARERLVPRELECRCRRHAHMPDCPRHGLTTAI